MNDIGDGEFMTLTRKGIISPQAFRGSRHRHLSALKMLSRNHTQPDWEANI